VHPVLYRWHLAGVLVATSGISLVALDNSGDNSDCTPEYGCLDDYAPGIIAALVSGLANAGKMVMAHSLLLGSPNRTTVKVRVAEISTWNCLVPSLLLWIPLLATREQQQYLDVLGPISNSDAHTLFVLLCVGLALGKMVDRLTKYGMVRLKGALFASMVDAIKKVLTAIVSIFALGETWSWSRGVSLALVFIAMGLYSYGSYVKAKASKATRKAAKEAELANADGPGGLDSRDSAGTGPIADADDPDAVLPVGFTPRMLEAAVAGTSDADWMLRVPAQPRPNMRSYSFDDLSYAKRVQDFNAASGGGAARTPAQHWLGHSLSPMGSLYGGKVYNPKDQGGAVSGVGGAAAPMLELPSLSRTSSRGSDRRKAPRGTYAVESSPVPDAGDPGSDAEDVQPPGPRRGRSSPGGRRRRRRSNDSGAGVWSGALSAMGMGGDLEEVGSSSETDSMDSDDGMPTRRNRAQSGDSAIVSPGSVDGRPATATAAAVGISGVRVRGRRSGERLEESDLSPDVEQRGAPPMALALGRDFTERVESAAAQFTVNDSSASALSTLTVESDMRGSRSGSRLR